MDVQINNQTKKGTKAVEKLPLNHNDKIRDIINLIKLKFNISLSSNRIGLYFVNNKNKKIYLTNKDRSLSSYNFEESYEIIVKDFGLQIDWRFVYVVEYLGPFLIFPFFYLLNLHKSANLTQNIGLLMGLFHYGKRIYESMFVHRFSRDTMPIKNLFVNVGYYWLLFGVSCGYSLFNDNYSETNFFGGLKFVFAILFFYFEIKNYYCHILQKNTKDALKGEHGILPNEHGYGLVSCANYFWEFLAWLCFSLFVNTISFYVFTAAGFYIMRKWAIEKHENYKTIFGDKYPKERKAFIPYLV